jgi:tRNA threonylcarbamoyladenosine biosynthesis protein TsaB
VLILALDTTSRAGSVAIARDGRVLIEHVGHDAVTHAQRLPGDIMDACRLANIEIAQVDLFAVAAGPGSFTGLRVGIATIQGLAVARGVKVVPVSTLEAVAASARGHAPRIAAWMDAQRGEVFAQVFDRRGESVGPLTDAISAPPAIALELQRAQLDGAAFHGDGARRYRDQIVAALGAVPVTESVPPLAAAIARMAAGRPGLAVLPHAIVPVYVRRPDAEIARDRRNARS